MIKLILVIVLLCFTYVESWAVNIELTVKEQEGITRSGEMIHNGVPIAKSENIKVTNGLIITDSGGTQIPATFEILSRWNGSPADTDKEIQWLLVSFPVSLSANQTGTFYLKDGTIQSVSAPLVVTNGASTITIDTGPAEFVISKSALTMFDSVSLGGTTLLSGGGGTTSTFNGQSAASANAPTLVEIERNNDNYTCIKVEGKYANTPVGTNYAEPMYYRIRYEFYAGSPTAIVTHKFYWPGDSGESTVTTIDSVINTLPTMTGLSSAEVYANASTYRAGALSTGSAKVEQKRKTLYADSSSARVTHGSDISSTTFATIPMLIAKNTNGTVAVSMDHMHRFEPQSIEVTSSGNIKVAPMAEAQYFAMNQGTWARFSVSALPAETTYSDAIASNFAPLNSRLFAFPSSSYVNITKVFGDIPIASSGTVTSTFINKIDAIANYSISFMETYKWQGLMTWGSMTRYADEIGSISGWNRIYSNTNLTDYHNTNCNYIYNFIYTSTPSWLYDISFNAARRMLNTQIVQPDDTKSNAYMGWAPRGYNSYRSDNNSSHSYFENLYTYYYLTGDKEVTDIISKAGATKRTWYTRSGGALVANTVYPVDFIGYTGRADAQSASMFNFLGHAYDSSYLDDFKAFFDHLLTTETVFLSNGDGKEYAFLTGKEALDGTITSSQIWMDSIYPLHYLHVLYNEIGDAQLGDDNILISRLLRAMMNSAIEYYAKTPGDGSWGGTWGNALNVNYSGNRVGGTLSSATLITGSDQYVYGSGKGPIAAEMLKTGRLLNDADMIQFGKTGIEYVETLTDFTTAQSKPFAKENGIFFTRLHSGVGAYYNDGVSSTHTGNHSTGNGKHATGTGMIK